jgi:hypothetical protein
MEKDRLETALRDRETEGGSAEMRVSERTQPSPFGPPTGTPGGAPGSTINALDPRHRRGSFGPIPVAPALDEHASGPALHAHLAQLLDAGRAPLSSAPHDDAEQQLGPHEDLERQPDGIPHLVIGLTALFSVALAAVLISMFRSGPTLGSVASVVIAIVAIPLLVFRLGAKAERERDHDHPSR